MTEVGNMERGASNKESAEWQDQQNDESISSSSSHRKRGTKRNQTDVYWKEEKEPTRRSPRAQALDSVSSSIESKDGDEQEDNNNNASASQTTPQEEDYIIDYEALRLENIRRNEEYLKSIGLLSAPTASSTSHKPLKKPTTASSSSSTRKPPASPQRRSKRILGEEVVETRRSKRIQGELAEVDGKSVGWGWEEAVQKAYAIVGDGVNNAVDGYGEDDEGGNVSYQEVDISAERAPITAQQIIDSIEATCPAHLDLISNDVSDGYLSIYLSRVF